MALISLCVYLPEKGKKYSHPAFGGIYHACIFFPLWQKEGSLPSGASSGPAAGRSDRRQLAAARCLFQQASDQELVAASVYEINALQARYSYLLHQAKLHEVRRSAWAAS